MRAANVYVHKRLVGRLCQLDDGTHEFVYRSDYLQDDKAPAVSLTLPKCTAPYQRASLFPAFWQLLPEGHNKRVLCQMLRIDPTDDFSILLRVATLDTVGAITVQASENE